MELFTNTADYFVRFDNMARGHSRVHHADARLKIIVFCVYLACVVSTPIDEVRALLPYFCFPCFIILVANLPLWVLVKRMLVFLPFTMLVGIFNPILDTTPAFHCFGVTITDGMLSFTSIVLRSILSILGAFTLISTTPVPTLCQALTKLKTPPIFVNLLMFFYRYVFIFIEDIHGISRAYQLRQGKSPLLQLSTWASIIGKFLVNSTSRAKAIYHAIQCRGGEFPVFSLNHHLQLNLLDCVACIFLIVSILLCKVYHLPKILDTHLNSLFS